MKKIIVILLCIASQSFAQKQIESKNVKLSISQNLIKINKNGINGNNISEESKIQKRFNVNSFIGEKFKGSGIIKFMQLTDTALTVRPDYVQYRKKIFDEMSQGLIGRVPGNSSIIKNINGYEVLIAKTEDESYICYLITSTNKSHNKVFNATIITLKTDVKEADKAVDDFIKSVKFK